MIDPIRVTRVPALSPGNPGVGSRIGANGSDDQAVWDTELNLVENLAQVLAGADIEPERHDTWLELTNCLILQPQIVSVDEQSERRLNTCSTIEVSHPQLGAHGTFEHQHAAGADLALARAQGFDS